MWLRFDCSSSFEQACHNSSWQQPFQKLGVIFGLTIALVCGVYIRASCFLEKCAEVSAPLPTARTPSNPVAPGLSTPRAACDVRVWNASTKRIHECNSVGVNMAISRQKNVLGNGAGLEMVYDEA